MKKRIEKAVKEGFAEPPDHITMPCFEYMGRVMDLRNFIKFFFGVIKSFGDISGLINQPQNIKIPKGKEITAIKYNYSEHRQLVNEIMLSRAVESFDLYLQKILVAIFLAKPEMLKSEGKIDVSTVIDMKNTEELIVYIAEKKINELSYKSLEDLSKYIKSIGGIELFEDKKIYEIVLLASEIRNLIAHNDCRANDRFLNKTRSLEEKIQISEFKKVIISDEWLRKASYTMDGVVFRFDKIASKKFSLKTHFRFGLIALKV